MLEEITDAVRSPASRKGQNPKSWWKDLPEAGGRGSRPFTSVTGGRRHGGRWGLGVEKVSHYPPSLSSPSLLAVSSKTAEGAGSKRHCGFGDFCFLREMGSEAI